MAPYSVTVHPFNSPTPGSCAYERGNPLAENALVFIGGLTGGPGVSDLTKLYQSVTGSKNIGFSVWEFRMRSSYTGFGYSSLANDAEDLAALVGYLRQIGKKKIVLMGHSTGCQDCLEYTNHDKYNSAAVDGYILLGPVSDREAATAFTSQDIVDATVKTAQDMLAEGKADDTMPSGTIPPIFVSPITAYRWNSLAAKGGDDDYFSSDLSDEQLEATFGRIDKPVLLLPCENDELVPPSVDRVALLKRWMDACPDGRVSQESGFVPGADHAVTQSETWTWISDKVVKFLHSV